MRAEHIDAAAGLYSGPPPDCAAERQLRRGKLSAGSANAPHASVTELVSKPSHSFAVGGERNSRLLQTQRTTCSQREGTVYISGSQQTLARKRRVSPTSCLAVVHL